MEEEGMDMDVVDGGGHKMGQSSSNGVSNLISTENGHDKNGDKESTDLMNSGDTTDMVSSLMLAAMAMPRPQGIVQQGPSSPTESSDSKKFWEALKHRLSLSGGSGEVEKGPFASCDPHDFFYNMNHKNRGRAIIFNHSEFDPCQRLDPRPGTDKDVLDVKRSLERLGFRAEIFNNLKYEKLYGILEEEALFNHKDDDCIAVVVLTHGGHDFLNAYDVPYKPESLWKMFSADKCPSLAGKPKMFFIQACRGEAYDEGTTLLSPKSRTVVDGPGDGKAYKIPNQSDFVMVFSTAPACEMTNSDNRTFVSRLFQFLSLSNSGHFSWRNSTKGGCFIQALCHVLDKYAYDMDMLSLTTLINREVAINYESNVPRDVNQHRKKQIPHVSHTLTRQIQFLRKGVHSTLV